MRQASIIVLLAFGILNANISLGDNSTSTTSDTLRVLVWNMWRGGNPVGDGAAKTLALFREVDADICLLQESYKNDEKGQLLGPWVAGELGWNSFQGKSTHLCVVTKHPIEETYFHEVWHGIGAKIATPRREVVAYSIWIDYRGYIPYHTRDNPNASDEDVLKCETERSNRLPQAQAIVKHLREQGHLAGERPLLVGGDWNTPSHLDWTVATARQFRHRRALALPISQMMYDEGFVDAWRVKYPDPVGAPGNTWSPLTQTDPLDRIDRLYYKNPRAGASWVAVGAKTLPNPWEDGDIPAKDRRFSSDHSAVVLDLEWVELRQE